MGRRKIILALCVVATALWGCGQQGDPEQEEDLSLDKADSTGKLVEHTSPIQEIGEIGVSLTDKTRGHAWTFTLGMTETVSIYTALFSGDADHGEVDTVLYLYQKSGQQWGKYIKKNDNASVDTKWSRLEEKLGPGEYRVVVWGRNKKVRGQFAVNLRCADGFCDYFDPSTIPPTEPEGLGTADQPGKGPISFRLPLLDENGELMSRYNDKLQAAGLPTFPDFVTVANSSNQPEADFNRYDEQARRDDVFAVTGSELMMFGDPDTYTDPASVRDIGLCYEGDATALASYLWAFADSIFSDQFLVFGWRAAGKSAYEEYHEPTASSGILEEWNAFDAASDSVLVVYSTDDNGTARTSIVEPCR